MPKILFIAPHPKGRVAKGTRKFHRKFPPLSLLICASLLREQGWQTEVNDLNANHRLSAEQVIKNAHRSDLVVLTTNPYADWQCPSYDIQPLFRFARDLPQDRLMIVGGHGTLYPKGVLSGTGAKVVIRGEPEQTILEVTQAFEKGSDLSKISNISWRNGHKIQHNRPAGAPPPLNEFPMPAYDLVSLNDYYYELLGDQFALLESSRGCPYSCSFCNQSMFQKRYRTKSADVFLMELDELVERHGCRSLYIFDLEFTINKKLVNTVCEHIIKKNYINRYGFRWTCQARADSVTQNLLILMRRSGCELIHFGVEAGNGKILFETGKGIKKSAIRDGFEAAKAAGLQTAGFFMFGLPGENKKNYKETLDFALELNPKFASFHPLLSIPGSPLFEEKFGKGPYWNEPFPQRMTFSASDQKKEILDFVKRAYLVYYLRFSYLAGSIKQESLNIAAKRLGLLFKFVF